MLVPTRLSLKQLAGMAETMPPPTTVDMSRYGPSLFKALENVGNQPNRSDSLQHMIQVVDNARANSAVTPAEMLLNTAANTTWYPRSNDLNTAHDSNLPAPDADAPELS